MWDTVVVFAGMTALGNGVTAGQGFGIELLITFVLVITVFATCDGSRNDLNGSGPLAIGLSVTMCHLGFVSITILSTKALTKSASFWFCN